MHPAPAFHVTDEAVLLEHLARFPFATIAAAPDGRPRVAHAPVLAVRHEGKLALEFHLSGRNGLVPFLEQGFRAVVVSLGPDAYVSPDWYADGADQVPTWNYVSVEAEGFVTAMGLNDTIAQLKALSAKMEATLAPKPPWKTSKVSPKRWDVMTRAIVGCRMPVERLEGIFKLGQNKTEADRAGVLKALTGDPIADWMRS